MKRIRSILIVDDSEADVFLATHYLQESQRYDHIWSRADGRAALDVFMEQQHSDEYPPEVILLDINMPRMGASNSWMSTGNCDSLTLPPSWSWSHPPMRWKILRELEPAEWSAIMS